VGPAANVDRAQALGLNGETEFNFLIVELGVIGAGVLLGLLAALIVRTFRRLRAIEAPDLRCSLAALAAPLVGMVVMFFSSAITAGSPGGPYLWAVAGVLAYWLGAWTRQERPVQPSVR
jgi:O-antigen ligase